MYKCGRCGKTYSTSRALGGHRSYCGSPAGSHSVSESVSGSHSLTGIASTHSLTKPLTHSLVDVDNSPILRQAEDVAKRYSVTGKRFNQVQWGKVLAAAAIGIFVAWLCYQSLDTWQWKGSKKQVSPYKLVGGLISGLG